MSETSTITCAKCDSSVNYNSLTSGRGKTLLERHRTWECHQCGWSVDVIDDDDGRLMKVNTRAAQEPQWQPIETAPRTA